MTERRAPSTPGIPFGDPRHPYRQTTEMATKAAQANKGKTPWRKGNWQLSKKKP